MNFAVGGDGLRAARLRARRAARKKRPLAVRILLFPLKLILAVHVAYIVITAGCIFAYKFVDPPFTVLMPYRSIGYGWKLQRPIPLPLSSIPSYLRTMLVAVEDSKFYTHNGIDMEAFKRAKEVNAILGKPVYGGSTLTMQVARTLFLVPEKSYVRKYFEVIAALELDFILSKERILELYFGYAEWGKGIFGIQAASRHYYGVGVASLTRDEGARLIALLSSPIKYTPATISKSAILRERYAYLIRRFVAPTLEPQPAEPSEDGQAPVAVEPGADLSAVPDTQADVVPAQEAAPPSPEEGLPTAEPAAGPAAVPPDPAPPDEGALSPQL